MRTGPCRDAGGQAVSRSRPADTTAGSRPRGRAQPEIRAMPTPHHNMATEPSRTIRRRPHHGPPSRPPVTPCGRCPAAGARKAARGAAFRDHPSGTGASTVVYTRWPTGTGRGGHPPTAGHRPASAVARTSPVGAARAAATGDATGCGPGSRPHPGARDQPSGGEHDSSPTRSGAMPPSHVWIIATTGMVQANGGHPSVGFSRGRSDHSRLLGTYRGQAGQSPLFAGPGASARGVDSPVAPPAVSAVRGCGRVCARRTGPKTVD